MINIIIAPLVTTTWLDFGNTLIIASMEPRGSRILYSYGADFDRIEEITRREP